MLERSEVHRITLWRRGRLRSISAVGYMVCIAHIAAGGGGQSTIALILVRHGRRQDCIRLVGYRRWMLLAPRQPVPPTLSALPVGGRAVTWSMAFFPVL